MGNGTEIAELLMTLNERGFISSIYWSVQNQDRAVIIF